MEPQEIGPISPAESEEIARIHCAVLPEGFLAQLGPSFLTQIYAAAVTAPATVGLVARDGQEIGGFVLATTDTRALFRHVLLRRGLRLAASLVHAVARRPTLLRQIVESLRYPSKRTLGRRPPGGDAELISIGIRPEHRAKGYGRALVLALNQEFARRGVPAYTVAVYSSSTEANAF